MIALHLRRREAEGHDLSDQQAWLFDRCVAVLEFRWAAQPAGHRCSCELCVPEQYSWDALESGGAPSA